MKKNILAILMLLVFTAGTLCCFEGEAQAAKKKIKPPRKIHRRVRRRAPRKAYIEYQINPAVREGNRDTIISALKDKGCAAASFNEDGDSLRLQFDSSKVSSLDILQLLKGQGYSVTNIN